MVLEIAVGLCLPANSRHSAFPPTGRLALRAAQLAGGGYAAYALGRSGTVWAWGDDLEGQLGNGSYGSSSDTPIEIRGLSRVRALAASANSAYALRSDGTVWAWGDDGEGELGNGEETYSRTRPVRVAGLSGISEIAAGEFSAYAVGRDGRVWAWGSNGSGQLGLSLRVTGRDVPVEVAGLSQATQVAAGASTAYALRLDGTVWAWGDNSFGELGRSPHFLGSEVPTPLAGLREITQVAAGASTGYALTAAGTVLAWGDGSFGALGSGCSLKELTRCPPSARPQRVLLPDGAIAIAAGTYAAYALGRNRTVWAWGYGAYGQLGDGRVAGSGSPVRVRGLTNIVAIAAGANAAYALGADGTLWAWGYGAYGQLGNGSTGSSDVPVRVAPFPQDS